MVRAFRTHKIRTQTELSGCIWSFSVLKKNGVSETLPVIVPSCWESYPGYERYRGTGEYRTSFEGQGNILLTFKGVAHQAWVFVDGREVGKHYNAYTPFQILLKDLQQGIHDLTVRVDNSFKSEYALNRPNDYMSYGGIIRSVLLEQLPDIYIENVHITVLNKTCQGYRTHFSIFLHNLSGQPKHVRLLIRLREKSGTVAFEQTMDVWPDTGHSIWESVFWIKNVQPWMPDDPILYEAEVLLYTDAMILDDFIDRFGFRIVSIKKNKLCINDRPVRIKGFNRHEDYALLGSAIPAAAADYDLRVLKDLGANAIRTSHYPNDEFFLDLCDERGILVWEEHHVRGGNERIMSNPMFEPYCEQVIKEMIWYHYNHPSIYIWGILNECASETQPGRSCYEKQYRLIRQLDQSRPCSSATCKFDTDICLDLPDVVSWNLYPGWYDDSEPAERVEYLYRWSQEPGRGTGKPFLITETGAGAIYGCHSHTLDKWTEEYQAYLLEKQIKAVLENEHCIGLYIWQFADARVSTEWFDKRPRTYNNKGILDEYRRRKLAYTTVKSIYSQYPDYFDS